MLIKEIHNEHILTNHSQYAVLGLHASAVGGGGEGGGGRNTTFQNHSNLAVRPGKYKTLAPLNGINKHVGELNILQVKHVFKTL